MGAADVSADVSPTRRGARERSRDPAAFALTAMALAAVEARAQGPDLSPVGVHVLAKVH
jgi:hypothetical protein